MKLFHRLLDQSNPDGGAGGGGAAPWFGEAHKGFVESKGWKTPDDAITSYANLEKLIGADRAGRTIVMPKDDKDVEGLKAFRAKLGVPEKDEEYQLPFPEGDSGEFSKVAAKWFHAHGVPKSAAQAIAKEWNGYFEQMMKAEGDRLKNESETQLNALKGEWGQDFDKRAELARRFLRASGWDDAKVQRYEQAFGTASMLKDFYGWGSKTGEHESAEGERGGGGFGMTPASAREKLEELRQQRIAGSISDKDFHAQMEKLAPIASAA